MSKATSNSNWQYSKRILPVQDDHQVLPYPHTFSLLQMLPGTQNQEKLQAYQKPYIENKIKVYQIILMQELTYINIKV
jgi:hypothetical protein